NISSRNESTSSGGAPRRSAKGSPREKNVLRRGRRLMSNKMSVDTFSQAAGESAAAVKNAGYYQEDKGTWHSPEKEEVAKKWLEDHSMRRHQSTVCE